MCTADNTEAEEASDALRLPSAESFITNATTCDSFPAPCSEGSWCLDGDLGVYCQSYPPIISSEEVRGTSVESVSFTSIVLFHVCYVAALRCIVRCSSGEASDTYVYVVAVGKCSPGTTKRMPKKMAYFFGDLMDLF